MSNYGNLFNPSQTPQNQPIPGKKQTQNYAGGYVFQLDNWGLLDRFLILGTDAPTYYASPQTLTASAGMAVLECWNEDPDRTAKRIVEISKSGRAPKQDPAIFALALGATCENVKARQKSYEAVPHVCRISTHLFQWMSTCRQLSHSWNPETTLGWGRGKKRVLANWYESRSTDQLAFQGIKYRQRHGYTHKRAIELSNKGAGDDEARKHLYLWLRGKETYDRNKLPKLITAHMKAMEAKDVKKLLPLVQEYRLPWEAIPTWALRNPDIWKAMMPYMGLTAMIRNLANMTEVGAIGPMETSTVVKRITDKEELQKARIHPFNVLKALEVYRAGRSFRASRFGSSSVKTWKPETKIIDALDSAFYMAFENAPSTGKRFLMALDLSGSMSAPMLDSPVTCRQAAGALALVTMARETETHVVGFTAQRRGGFTRNSGLEVMNISPRQRLDDVVKIINRADWGGTDCSLPMQYALKNQIPVDVFVVLTDNDTWAGKIHPCQALWEYRKKMKIPAKLIVVGMTATQFSIADPNDAGMLDIVGFDSSGPNLIADFAKE